MQSLISAAPYDDATTELGASNIGEAIEAIDRRLDRSVFEFSFSQGDIFDEIYVVNHNLDTDVVSVVIFDSFGEEFEADSVIAIDSNNTAIGLKNFLPIQGVCKGKVFA